MKTYLKGLNNFREKINKVVATDKSNRRRKHTNKNQTCADEHKDTEK